MAVINKYRLQENTLARPEVAFFGTLLIWLSFEMKWIPQIPLGTIDGRIPLAVIACACLTWLWLPRRPLHRSLRWAAVQWSFVFRALVLLCGFIIPLGMASGFLTPREMKLDWFNVGSMWLLFMGAALPEEILFRGILQEQLQRLLPNKVFALAIASVVFGLAHLNNATPHFAAPNIDFACLATIAGVFYGWVWMQTRNLLSTVLIHAHTNFFGWLLFQVG